MPHLATAPAMAKRSAQWSDNSQKDCNKRLRLARWGLLADDSVRSFHYQVTQFSSQPLNFGKLLLHSFEKC